MVSDLVWPILKDKRLPQGYYLPCGIRTIREVEAHANKIVRGNKGVLVQIQKIEARIAALEIEKDYYLKKLLK